MVEIFWLTIERWDVGVDCVYYSGGEFTVFTPGCSW